MKKLITLMAAVFALMVWIVQSDNDDGYRTAKNSAEVQWHGEEKTKKDEADEPSSYDPESDPEAEEEDFMIAHDETSPGYPVNVQQN